MSVNYGVATGFSFLDTNLITDMFKLRLWNGLSEGHCLKLRVISIYDCPEFDILLQFNLFISFQHLNMKNCLQLQYNSALMVSSKGAQAEFQAKFFFPMLKY